MALSIFQKFGGIRPMAAKLGVPPSTVKSWHAKREIPTWRRQAVVDCAISHGLDVSLSEVEVIVPDAPVESAAAA